MFKFHEKQKGEILMLRNKGLTDKLLLLGVDGMDPRFTKRMVEEGKMPNFKKINGYGFLP